LFSVQVPRRKEVTYKNKPLSEWFYGDRKAFFKKSTQDAAGDAFKALRTNALPFLLSSLKKRGSPVLYFRLYRGVPSRIQAWLPYPISGDDIQMMTLSHLVNMGDMPPEWLAALAKQVPGLRNPRVRYHGLGTVHRLAQNRRDGSLIKLCKDLLDDSHSGVRLQAAILLAELDPGETRGFAILLGALEDREKLNSSLAVRTYLFRQPPGGSGGVISLPFLGQTPRDSEMTERQRILRALERLQPRLDEQQRRLVLRYKEASQSR